MNKFIDLHSHIAWGIDDGIENKENSIEALKMANQDGIVGICSTPHIVPGKIDEMAFKTILQRQYSLLKLAQNFNIFVYSGAEMMMNIDFMDAINQDLYLTLNESRYILVEFDLRWDIHFMPYIFEYLEELVFRSFVPVIAHIERYFPEDLDLDLIDQFLDIGCLLQSNRTSLLGYHGKNIQKNAMKLLENKKIHLICSDAHRSTGRRIERLSDVYQVIKQKFGVHNANLLCFYNPYSILDNKETENMV